MPGVRVSDSDLDIGINVSTPDYSTNGNGTGVVFNIPNASEITYPTNSGNGLGHLIAPQADVYNLQGTYTGCEIVKNFYSTSEGHMYPYNASLSLDLDVLAVVVNKVWYGPRAESVTVYLYANDEHIETYSLGEFNQWKLKINNLPVYDSNNNEIKYTVEERLLDLYECGIYGNITTGFIIENVHFSTLGTDGNEGSDFAPETSDPILMLMMSYFGMISSVGGVWILKKKYR